MRTLREWLQRLAGSLRRGRRDADLEEELRVHLQMAADEAHRRGLDPASAGRAAQVAAGGRSQAMDALRDQRGLPVVDDFTRDVRHGLRMLRRSPVFTAVALLTLALGIGANTAIFSIVNAVILRPLVYPRPEQLMRITAQFPMRGTAVTGLSNPEYDEYRRMNRCFAQVGAFTTGGMNIGGGSGAWAGEVNITAGDRPLRVRSAGVDAQLLDTLGVQPAQGRFFAPGETDALAERPGLGGPALAILSHKLWQAAFGGDSIVGKTVSVDGRVHDVIGIMPPGVDLLDTQPEIWLPLGVHPVIRQLRASHLLNVIGRLKEGVTPQEAQAEVNAFLENWGDRSGAKGHLPTTLPARPDDHRIDIQPLQDSIVGDASRAIWVLQGAVALILLIACVNLANLAMARGESRRREFAVRAALGASRTRLLRQAMTEGVILSIAGGAIGVWLARVGIQALTLFYPDSLPRTTEVAIDVPVLVFALTVSIATGLVFGLGPAAQRHGHELIATIRDGGDRSASRGRHGLRRILVTAEVALAMLLVTSAGLLLRTVSNLSNVDAGFDRSHLVTFSMTLPRGTSDSGGRASVYQRLIERLRTTPGVHAVTAMSHLPLHRFVQGFSTRVESATAATGQANEIVDYYQFVMSDYFHTMRIPIVAGRAFDASDAASRERVTIVSETLANRLWKGHSPLGQRVRPNLSASIGASSSPWHTVIGVAKDVKEGGVDRDAGTELYLFIDQPGPSDGSADSEWVATAPPTMHIVVRTGLPLSTLSSTFERAVREADPAVPIVRLREMDEVFAESIRRPRLLAQLLGGFAALALMLAAVGTYGVLSYMVTERRREIGIRVALGAARSSVVAMVMKQGMQTAGVGIATGLAGAIAVTRLMGSLLFGVEPHDPATLAVVAVTIATVAALACWLPAWRAARLDPNEVLRAD